MLIGKHFMNRDKTLTQNKYKRIRREEGSAVCCWSKWTLSNRIIYSVWKTSKDWSQECQKEHQSSLVSRVCMYIWQTFFFFFLCWAHGKQGDGLLHAPKPSKLWLLLMNCENVRCIAPDTTHTTWASALPSKVGTIKLNWYVKTVRFR